MTKKTDAERAPIFMRKCRGGLFPASAFDAERLDLCAPGVDIEVTMKQRRSLPQMRLYWGMLARVVENTDGWATSEHLHEAIKLHLGYTRPVKTIDGRPAWMADSIAFANMDAAEFRVFFDRAAEAIATFILPGVDPLALVKEGSDLVSVSPADLAKADAA